MYVIEKCVIVLQPRMPEISNSNLFLILIPEFCLFVTIQILKKMTKATNGLNRLTWNRQRVPMSLRDPASHLLLKSQRTLSKRLVFLTEILVTAGNNTDIDFLLFC